MKELWGDDYTTKDLCEAILLDLLLGCGRLVGYTPHLLWIILLITIFRHLRLYVALRQVNRSAVISYSLRIVCIQTFVAILALFARH